MKQIATLTLLTALALGAGAAFAGDKMADMKGMGMDMGKPSVSSAKTHQAVGVVKALDVQAGTVTLAHEPVKSLNWPAMSMTFGVKDKMLFDRLAKGKKVEVEFEFVQEGKGYIVTGVK